MRRFPISRLHRFFFSVRPFAHSPIPYLHRLLSRYCLSMSVSAMSRSRLREEFVRIILLSFFLYWLFPQGEGWGQTSSPSPATKTWRLVTELTADERALFDPHTETPRDPQYPNLPAERYPFEPPYTAEEMGYRAMEFSHSPRWSCNLIDVTGALTAQGFLRTSKMYSPIFYVPNASGHYGLAGELYDTSPGGPTRKITGQNKIGRAHV